MPSAPFSVFREVLAGSFSSCGKKSLIQYFLLLLIDEFKNEPLELLPLPIGYKFFVAVNCKRFQAIRPEPTNQSRFEFLHLKRF